MKQLSLPCRGRGGFRPGAGRKRGHRISHHGRDSFVRPLPLHAVWRTRRDVRSLRGKKLFRQLRESFRRCHEKPGFRLTHFSVLGTHVHLIVEADDTALLSRGMQGLGVSMAKRINLTTGRRGSAFDDRYFARPLRTPREAASAVDYVLDNEEQHLRRQGLPLSPGRGLHCSEAYLDAHPPLIAPPRTWLLRSCQEGSA